MEEPGAGPSMPNPPTPTALSLTPITEGIKPGGGKKRQRPQSTAGAATPQLEEHGLRNYALRVCNIVQSLRETTYAHVADTLVDELTEENPALDPEHDGRNIRRRVYDALNVLEALEILTKEKQRVRWQGFPNSQFSRKFEQQQVDVHARAIAEKEATLRGLMSQYLAVQQLYQRNRARAEAEAGSDAAFPPPAAAAQASVPVALAASTLSSVPGPDGPLATVHGASSAADIDAVHGKADAAMAEDSRVSTAVHPETTVSTEGCPSAAGTSAACVPAAPAEGGAARAASTDLAALLRSRRIPLPAQLVQTQTPSTVDLTLTDDRTALDIRFEHPFSVHDEMEVLRALGLGAVRPDDDPEALRLPPMVRGYAQGVPLAVVSEQHAAACAAAATTTDPSEEGPDDAAVAADGPPPPADATAADAAGEGAMLAALEAAQLPDAVAEAGEGFDALLFPPEGAADDGGSSAGGSVDLAAFVDNALVWPRPPPVTSGERAGSSKSPVARTAGAGASETGGYACNRCGNVYSSTDAARKHARKQHPEWLKALGQGSSALYCTVVGASESKAGGGGGRKRLKPAAASDASAVLPGIAQSGGEDSPGSIAAVSPIDR